MKFTYNYTKTGFYFNFEDMTVMVRDKRRTIYVLDKEYLGDRWIYRAADNPTGHLVTFYPYYSTDESQKIVDEAYERWKNQVFEQEVLRSVDE